VTGKLSGFNQKIKLNRTVFDCFIVIFCCWNREKTVFAHFRGVKAFLLEETYIHFAIYCVNGVHFGTEKTEDYGCCAAGIGAELQGDTGDYERSL
jgi:hypothetical protein